MKIGLLTVPFNNNYGGLLQAYALKNVLVSMGNEVIIINRRRNRPRGLKFKVYDVLVNLHIIEDYLTKRTEALSIHTDIFKREHLSPITEPYYSNKDLIKSLKLGIDAFVVGSDQVWRYRYAQDSIDDFFFSFLRGSGIPRFSYAASFGTEIMDYPEEKKHIVSQLLNEFCAISVREKSGKDLLTKYLGVSEENAKVVLDPTLLLTARDYLKLFDGLSRPQAPYLFTYILDNDLIPEEMINSFLKDRGISRVDMKAQTGDASKLAAIEPVEKWLSSIYYSDFVLTDSFHGTVFSIIFNKPFIVVANPVRGIARLRDLLGSMGLEDRLVLDRNGINMKLFNKSIDWPHVNELLGYHKKESLSFLEAALKCSSPNA